MNYEVRIMKTWNVLSKTKVETNEDLIKLLLENRNINTKKEIEEFLHPRLDTVTPKNVGIDVRHLKKTVARIQKAIKKKEQIIVFGDYDVDGICGSAILWETIHELGGTVLPYIPHRIEEGYGLSVRAMQSSEFRTQNPRLIITVDNGIVAHSAVEFANKNGIDVIITDHHVRSKTNPKAFAIVHTTQLCGAGVAYMLSQELLSSRQVRTIQPDDAHLELVALATVADLVPLIGANRTLLKLGLEALQKTNRVGLLALFKEAGIDSAQIDTYIIGHIIAPRLNAMGRLETAMDSLRLICTKSKDRAEKLAFVLGDTNRQRQLLTVETATHAIAGVRNAKKGIQKILFVADASYQQGVIGLVAGKLVEEFYRPSIVLSVGEKYAKASARSIPGFNIIEFIRMADEHLVDAGGHPMAAGFTVETAKIQLLQKVFEEKIAELLDDGLLTKTLRIDCELPLSLVSFELYNAIQTLSPFGMANPQPLFVSKNVTAEDVRLIGKDQRHIKFKLNNIEAIAFGFGERIKEFSSGKPLDIVYTIDENTWNGNKSLQLKIKDVKWSIHQ